MSMKKTSRSERSINEQIQNRKRTKAYQEQVREAHGVKPISELQEGEIGYAVPWAFHVTADGQLEIAATAQVCSTEGGTAMMELRRVNGKLELHGSMRALFDTLPMGDYLPIDTGRAMVK